MSNFATMSVVEIRKKVLEVEGFNVQITGCNKLVSKLHMKRKSNGQISVASWIKNIFPNIEGAVVSVLNGKDLPIRKVNVTKLEAVRLSYPKKTLTELINSKLKSEQQASELTDKLDKANVTAKKKSAETRAIKNEFNQKIDNESIAAEKRAVLETMEDLLQNRNTYHPRIIEKYNNALEEGLESTPDLIKRILDILHVLETNNDRLTQKVLELQTKIEKLSNKPK